MPNLKVKNVIWLYYANDIFNLVFELKNPILRLYLNDVNFNQNLINKQKIIDKLIQKQIDQEYKKIISKEKKTDQTAASLISSAMVGPTFCELITS